MWRKILTSLFLFCLWPIVGLAQLPRTPLAQETLRGLPGVRLIVEDRCWGGEGRADDGPRPDDCRNPSADGRHSSVE